MLQEQDRRSPKAPRTRDPHTRRRRTRDPGRLDRRLHHERHAQRALLRTGRGRRDPSRRRSRPLRRPPPTAGLPPATPSADISQASQSCTQPACSPADAPPARRRATSRREVQDRSLHAADRRRSHARFTDPQTRQPRGSTPHRTRPGHRRRHRRKRCAWEQLVESVLPSVRAVLLRRDDPPQATRRTSGRGRTAPRHGGSCAPAESAAEDLVSGGLRLPASGGGR